MPTFNDLNVTLSNRINDPVAAAATDGSKYSSAFRVDYLNQAIRRWMQKMVIACKITGDFSPLRDYTAEEAQTLAANVKALSGWTGGVFHVISAYNATDSLPVKQVVGERQRFFVESGGNSYITASATNQYWTEDGSNFRLIDGSTTNADSLRLRYVKQHTDLVAGGTILVPSQYHGDILDIAEALAFEDVPTSENVARGMAKEQRINREVGAV